MKKNYRNIEFMAGENIESAIKELKSHKDLVCGSFNGQILYSDVDDIDSAYKKITGKTKAECDEAERKRHEEYEAENKRHEEAIPRLTEEWIEKGKTILDEKHHELWNKIVPIRLGDLYKGMELGDCLDIVKELNAGCELDAAKKIIEEQGHSGMSFGLVCSMIKTFCDRGEEFVKYARQ
jgi:ribosomal protein S21